jgi:hypothetical protein
MNDTDTRLTVTALCARAYSGRGVAGVTQSSSLTASTPPTSNPIDHVMRDWPSNRSSHLGSMTPRRNTRQSCNWPKPRSLLRLRSANKCYKSLSRNEQRINLVGNTRRPRNPSSSATSSFNVPSSTPRPRSPSSSATSCFNVPSGTTAHGQYTQTTRSVV